MIWHETSDRRFYLIVVAAIGAEFANTTSDWLVATLSAIKMFLASRNYDRHWYKKCQPVVSGKNPFMLPSQYSCFWWSCGTRTWQRHALYWLGILRFLHSHVQYPWKQCLEWHCWNRMPCRLPFSLNFTEQCCTLKGSFLPLIIIIVCTICLLIKKSKKEIQLFILIVIAIKLQDNRLPLVALLIIPP